MSDQSNNPYEAPSSKLIDKSNNMGQLNIMNGFKDPTFLTRLLYAILVLSFVATLVGWFFDFEGYQLLITLENSPYAIDEQMSEAFENNEAKVVLMSLAQMGIFIFELILTLSWIYRANKNIRALGALNMEITPGWSVGWFFIPFANLWKPYQAVKEIFVNSKKLAMSQVNKTGHFLPIWWGSYLLSGVLSRISAQLASREDLELSGYKNINILDQMINLTNIVNIIVLFFYSQRDLPITNDDSQKRYL